MRMLRSWLEGQRSFWSSRPGQWWAILVTVYWLTIMVVVILWKFSEFTDLKLNELGDLIAGVFSPVAFGWLVWGYIQQGKELKLSSEALRMQADELRSSVEQQTAMAEAQKISLENHERTLEPLLVLTHIKTVLDERGYGHEAFLIENTASYCESVTMECAYKGAQYREQVSVFPSLLVGDSHEFSVAPMPGNSEMTVTLHYTKISGLKNCQSFTVKKFVQEDGCRVFIQKHPFTKGG